MDATNRPDKIDHSNCLELDCAGCHHCVPCAECANTGYVIANEEGELADCRCAAGEERGERRNDGLVTRALDSRDAWLRGVSL